MYSTGKMKKEEFIRRRGEVAYERYLQQGRDSHARLRKGHQEEANTQTQAWREANPERVKASNHEGSRKGGKYYEHTLEYNKTGIRGERNKLRRKHRGQYIPFKQIIAPESQIHHEWIPGTAEYTGVALVEKDQHMHGFVDVIKILDGKITLFTEREIGEQVVK